MNFPKDFIWGTATSAYQIEGAYNRDGKGVSIWDTFCHTPGKINDNETGDIACDHYDKYEDDIKLMAELGISAYRFSISWTRIFPEGDDEIPNAKGLQFYDNLVNCCLKNGITPHITLFHWDLPQTLEDDGGWLSERTINAFVKYAELICEHFSDRVEYFSTINEPQIITRMGYSTGLHAPGLTLPDDTVLEILHSIAKAHAAAVRAMRKCAKRKIKIGFSSTGNLCYPSTGSKEDIEMAKKLTFSTNKEDFLFCHQIFCDAVILGKTCEYNRSWDDVEALNPLLDFLGLNIYNGHEVNSDGIVKHGIGFARTALKWPVTPEVLCWGPVFMYERYKLPIIITENGFSCNDHIFLDGKVHDADRIDYLTRYINELSKAIDAGTDVIGYFHWSFTDNFEWHSGYNERFGLVYIDYATGRRIPKDSFRWYSQLIRR